MHDKLLFSPPCPRSTLVTALGATSISIGRLEPSRRNRPRFSWPFLAFFTMNQTRHCSNTYSIYNYCLALTSAQRWPISTQNPRVQRRQGYELGGCSRSVLRHMVTIVQLPRPCVLVDCSIGEWMVAHSTAKLVDVFTSSQMLLKVKMAWTRISSACC